MDVTKRSIKKEYLSKGFSIIGGNSYGRPGYDTMKARSFKCLVLRDDKVIGYSNNYQITPTVKTKELFKQLIENDEVYFFDNEKNPKF